MIIFEIYLFSIFFFGNATLAGSLEPLAHRSNVASPGLFFRCYFSRCSPERTELLPFPDYCRRSSRCSKIGYLIFLLPFLDVIRMSMSTISFLAQLDSGILYLQNTVYAINGLKSRVNRLLF